MQGISGGYGCNGGVGDEGPITGDKKPGVCAKSGGDHQIVFVIEVRISQLEGKPSVARV